MEMMAGAVRAALHAVGALQEEIMEGEDLAVEVVVH